MFFTVYLFLDAGVLSVWAAAGWCMCITVECGSPTLCLLLCNTEEEEEALLFPPHVKCLRAVAGLLPSFLPSSV